MSISSFVLVHGAFHGAWSWDFVAPLLESAGHPVYTPTLTGLGTRAAELTAATGLAAHRDDVLAAIDAAGGPVVLVGHSYGILPAALATGHGAVRALISLDGIAITPGQAMIDTAPPEAVTATRAILIDGLAVPTWPPEAFDIPREHFAHAYAAARLTPMPWRPITEPLPPLPARLAGLPRGYLAAMKTGLDGSRAGVDQASREGWAVMEIDGGHDCMLTAPAATAAALLALANS